MNEEQVKSQEIEEAVEPDAMGLPSDEEIAKLKEQYGELELVEIGGDVYIYRRITRSEHKILIQEQALEKASDADEEIVKRFLVWPQFANIDWDVKGAGVIPTLSQHIMRFSGFIATSNPIKL